MGDTYVDEKGNVRLKDHELVIPICVGTVSFWLGKKAPETQSHKWTVYVRGPNNEDLSHVISKVTFTLHHTFKDSVRACEGPIFEVTETGWGEFEIIVTVHFSADACEREVQLFHKLKLYGTNDAGGPNVKKPVVSETYDELVFVDPIAAFASRIAAVTPQPLNPPSTLVPYFPTHSETEVYDTIQACRAKVAAMCAEVRSQFDSAT